MLAIVYENYGMPDVLKVTDVPKPVPGNKEVLVKVHATSVTAADRLVRSLEMPAGYGLLGRLVFGVFGPRKHILGTEFAGEVEAVGSQVTRFKPGDEVFAFPGAGLGGYAQYAKIGHNKAIALKPANFTYSQAVALSFGGSTALEFLRKKGKIKQGDRVLVVGAAGIVGSAAVQLAKYFGAHVTGVCRTDCLEMVRMLGADEVIDYTSTDFTVSGETYDIILDTSGTVTYRNCEAALQENGRLLLVTGNLWQLLAMVFTPKKRGKKGIGGYAPERAEDLVFLASLAEAGKFTPYIDRQFPLEDAAKAHAFFESGRKKGSVVITVGPSAT
ncbi:MAG: NAD(P)-dependent alcohol dehydrogenase [Marinosulfonomonas sp.]|nr:NAD(P)-dependent alcohol dehydrogenase [Marinosulfonomonas sp.]